MELYCISFRQVVKAIMLRKASTHSCSLNHLKVIHINLVNCSFDSPFKILCDKKNEIAKIRT